MLAIMKQFGGAIRDTFGGGGVQAAGDMDLGGHWSPAYGGVQTQAGEVVSEDRSMTLPAVFCACWNLCSHLAMLSLPLLRTEPNGDKTRLESDPRDQMFNLEANGDMTAISARSARHFHALLWGNSVSEIIRNGRRDPVGFYPLDPDRVSIKRRGGRLIYEHRQPDGSTETLFAEDVLHVTGMSRDGINGYPLIRMLARENIGLQLAIESYARSFFGNGVSIGTIFKYPHSMKPEEHKHHLEMIRQEYGAPQNRGKPFLATNGMEVDRGSMTNKDAMMVESLTWSVGDIARWLNMPPHFLKDLSRATFSNIEHISLDYVKYTLTAWLKRFEQEDSRKLLTRAERANLRFKHDINSLLRGDMAARTEFYKLMSERGMSPNDILRLENMNSIGTAGDQHLVQLNMTTLEQMLQAKVNGENGDGAAEDPRAADVAFKREVVKALINDGTIGDVIFNLMEGRELLKQVNITTHDGPAEPWLPVVASAGPLVSGDTITDGDGDVVGGDTLGGTEASGTAGMPGGDGAGTDARTDDAPADDAPPDDAEAVDKDTDGDDPDDPERMARARALFGPIWNQAVERIRTRVRNNRDRKNAKPMDAIIGDQTPKAVAELGPIVEAIGAYLGDFSGERALAVTRAAATRVVEQAEAPGIADIMGGGFEI